MHPVLLDLGFFKLHSYGVFAAIAFLPAIVVLRKLATLEGLNVDKMIDLGFWEMLLGFVGARGLFVITRWEYFMENPAAIIKIWEGGLVFFGGLLLGIPFGIWFVRKHRLNPWKAFDVMMPALCIAHMFGRFGCFSAGCCYGLPTDGPFGVKFGPESLVDQVYHGVAIHPTQLYEAFALLLIFGALIFLRGRKIFDGQVGLTYIMVYSVVRSIIETFRGDIIRGFVIEGWLSTSQFISLLLFVAAGGLMIYRYRVTSVQMVRE